VEVVLREEGILRWEGFVYHVGFKPGKMLLVVFERVTVLKVLEMKTWHSKELIRSDSNPETVLENIKLMY